MARDTLTGSRIRERRIMAGIKQADLARLANISASYLNLIEHNRRRIGGKLLMDIAYALDVEPTLLTEGAEAALLSNLREAASSSGLPAEELSRVEEFAGRFPGWARLLSESHNRIETMEHSVEVLTDRLTHDPQLSASLHEMLSTVTAIRSAASILTDPGGIEPEWQRRFTRNIFEDSARLAESSQSLVQYLEATDDSEEESNNPQDEFDAYLQSHDYHFPELEEDNADVAGFARDTTSGLSNSASWLVARHLAQYRKDAKAIPLSSIPAFLDAHGIDPLGLANEFSVDAAMAMRRLASLPQSILRDPVGLAVCDGSGVLTYRKPLSDFPLPRLGAGCGLWPLYRALAQPMVVQARILQQASRASIRHFAFAIAQPVGAQQLGKAVLFESHMLFLPNSLVNYPAEEAVVGLNCRICARDACDARREQSILGPQTNRTF